ncbi:hypothetical protein THAOC_04333 [Thalassiosira oceanica]|uniref:Uncharacterized protein n=1 Tax=Thalassiosira oceanica TaxID=159749 RepID=K0TP02_THAOC|nr:hypothetical protein THAOC_04333 [Thalassiosira oceanica]|eukprot:EJK74017.1 hypothetical protein THAOC_04333 [Thalassiosira oceanica]
MPRCNGKTKLGTSVHLNFHRATPCFRAEILGSETESEVFVPRNAKRNEKEDSVGYHKSYDNVNRVARPPGPGHQASNTTAAGFGKNSKPADGAGEYPQISADLQTSLSTVVADWKDVGRKAPANQSLVDTVEAVDMGEPIKAVPVGLAPRTPVIHRPSISPNPPPPGDLNLIEYPVQAGRQQPLPRPGERRIDAKRPRHVRFQPFPLPHPARPAPMLRAAHNGRQQPAPACLSLALESKKRCAPESQAGKPDDENTSTLSSQGDELCYSLRWRRQQLLQFFPKGPCDDAQICRCTS